MKQTKIYFAGPDVFYREVFDIAKEKKRIIHDLSNGRMIGCHPFDNDVEQMSDPMDMGRMISRENRKMMDQCDIILANITPFRGANIDDGTAFEIGYMMAQGKPVYAYSNAGTKLYIENVVSWADKTEGVSLSEIDKDGCIRDHDGAVVEQFGFPCNLMIGDIIEGRFAVTDTPQPPTDLSAFEQVVNLALIQYFIV